MKTSDEKILKYTILSSVILSISLFVYWTLNKEQINLIASGKELEVSTFTTTVKDLLEENNIKYDADDIVTPSLEDEITDYMDVRVIDVKKKKIVKKEEVDYEVQIIEDSNLLKGVQNIEQEGTYGEKEITYEYIYHDGKYSSKNIINEKITKEANNKIVKKGTKDIGYDIASRGGSSSAVKLNVEATAYAGDGITATGTVPKWGTIAVDPKVIPYGTKVYIPRFEKIFVAEDCGGAIKGNIIDIFMNSDSQAYDWGRRDIEIYILN